MQTNNTEVKKNTCFVQFFLKKPRDHNLSKRVLQNLIYFARKTLGSLARKNSCYPYFFLLHFSETLLCVRAGFNPPLGSEMEELWVTATYSWNATNSHLEKWTLH